MSLGYTCFNYKTEGFWDNELFIENKNILQNSQSLMSGLLKFYFIEDNQKLRMCLAAKNLVK